MFKEILAGLILPSGWSHDVMTLVSNYGVNIAVNYWFT